MHRPLLSLLSLLLLAPAYAHATAAPPAPAAPSAATTKPDQEATAAKKAQKAPAATDNQMAADVIAAPPAPKSFAEILEGKAATWTITAMTVTAANAPNYCNARRTPTPASEDGTAAAPILQGLLISMTRVHYSKPPAGVAADDLQINLAFSIPKKDEQSGLTVDGTQMLTKRGFNQHDTFIGSVSDLASFREKIARTNAVFQLGDASVGIPGPTLGEVMKKLDECVAQGQ